MSLRGEHAAACALSDRWFIRDEAAWRQGLAFGRMFDIPLLALIHQRFYEVRAAVEREAAERGVRRSVIAREWREALAKRRAADNPASAELLGIVGVENDREAAGRKSCSS